MEMEYYTMKEKSIIAGPSNRENSTAMAPSTICTTSLSPSITKSSISPKITGRDSKENSSKDQWLASELFSSRKERNSQAA